MRFVGPYYSVANPITVPLQPDHEAPYNAYDNENTGFDFLGMRARMQNDVLASISNA